MSRAAKGADCKSAGLAFAGSSPASPTTLKSLRNFGNWPPTLPAFFMSRMSHIFSSVFNGPQLSPVIPRDMRAT